MEVPSRSFDRSALVLYGSETGSAQDVAEEIGRVTERLRFNTKVVEMDSVGIHELLCHKLVVFTISTTGQGDVPGNAQSFWRKLRNVRLKPGCLTGLEFASFGLGDSSYPKFNWAHRKLHNRIKQLGGLHLGDRGESDEQHPEGIDGTFLPWVSNLRALLLNKYPLEPGIDPIADDVFLTPRWSLCLVDQVSPEAEVVSNGNPSIGVNGHNHRISSDTRAATIRATLISNKRVTPDLHWQDVRMFDFSTPKIEYQPGDVLTVFPYNSIANVDDFLSIMKWTSAMASMAVDFVPSDINIGTNDFLPLPFSRVKETKVTLHEFIMRHLDLNAIPRRSFFAAIAHFTQDKMQRDRLIEFTNPEYIDELFDYTTRPRRSILEVLQEFDTVNLPLEWIASIIPTIRGRQFSIASGGILKSLPNGLGRIQILVAVVKYRTVIKKIREGLCTKYMAGLQPGTALDVQLCKGGMKLHTDRPAIMVGPGTGVAPLRSMLYEKLTSEHFSEFTVDHDMLFFGGRNRLADYFFEEDWNELKQRIPLRVCTAFSRDQNQKVYVQDVIREQSKAVYQTLQDGVVYVCGSSGKMPQAVREALIDVFAQEGHLERFEAESHLIQMEKYGRYQQETW